MGTKQKKQNKRKKQKKRKKRKKRKKQKKRKKRKKLSISDKSPSLAHLHVMRQASLSLQPTKLFQLLLPTLPELQLLPLLKRLPTLQLLRQNLCPYFLNALPLSLVVVRVR